MEALPYPGAHLLGFNFWNMFRHDSSFRSRQRSPRGLALSSRTFEVRPRATSAKRLTAVRQSYLEVLIGSRTPREEEYGEAETGFNEEGFRSDDLHEPDCR
jgi:hypothetical protein